jgi:hypothetical protein
MCEGSDRGLMLLAPTPSQALHPSDAQKLGPAAHVRGLFVFRSSSKVRNDLGQHVLN